MKKQTAQLALDALTSLDSTLEFTDWENGAGEKIGEQLRNAVAALESDIALAVEPFGWVSRESIYRIKRGGNGSKGTVPIHAKASSISRIPLYTTPSDPGVNAGSVSYTGMSDEVDFSTDRWTFVMDPGYQVSAGQYRITKIPKATS